VWHGVPWTEGAFRVAGELHGICCSVGIYTPATLARSFGGSWALLLRFSIFAAQKNGGRQPQAVMLPGTETNSTELVLLGISKLRLPAGKRPGSQSHADQQLAKKCQLEDDFQPGVELERGGAERSHLPKSCGKWPPSF